GTNTISQYLEWDILQVGLTGNPGDQSSTEGETISLALHGASGSGGTPSFSVSGLPDGLSFIASTTLITGTIAAGAAADGPFVVTVEVADGTALSQVQLNWSVSPFIGLTAIDDQSSTEGNTISLSVSASFAGTLTPSFSASGLPSGVSINASTGLITGTIAA